MKKEETKTKKRYSAPLIQ